MNDVISKVRSGDVRTVAKLIRDIDDGIPGVWEILKELHPYTGRAYVLGVTGAPGVGKSTLVDGIISAYRAKDISVGVIAVDPTSPFTGGAILGDRIRMQRHSTDPGVFIRSLATRGQFGGLTQSTRHVVDVFDAMGKEIIIVETVGVGQDEIDIVRTAHTTLIVTIPGMGDDIQAIKAGILEIGDVFVVNKADKDGADRAVQDIQLMLEMNRRHRQRETRWIPRIVKTEAHRGLGLDKLLEEITAHREHLFRDGREHLAVHLRNKAKIELIDLIKQRVFAVVMEEAVESHWLDSFLDDIIEKKIDPFTVCDRFLTEKNIRNLCP
ncbi:MAG: methylmalonyl Co-A mutase-associated GTPase MeaB [Deltaproteobacteria bacterium]|nr:methylmalonyl Co-A mutase-associated GTPase MeaB [Deltaproteobacteria bacterium]